MKRVLFVFSFLLFIGAAFCQQKNADVYFPSAKTWERRSPLLPGFDTSVLNEAIRFAIKNESRRPRDMRQSQQLDFGKEPFNEPIGSFADRGDPTGLIIHKGYIIAEWGDPSKVEMTHSVSKSFLSTVVGLAVDKGMIKDVNDPVGNYVDEITCGPIRSGSSAYYKIKPFASEHNKKINWETLLHQTSDWEGSLWGKPDWADRPDPDSTKWRNRKRNEPGAVFEYNDVRVNILALAATWVWKRSLAQVLDENIMKPIGASSSWDWQGYYHSFIDLGGDTLTRCVSGGGHWGGGMFINAYDMGRFGLLSLHKGKWNGRQLISEKWIDQSTTPTTANKEYGYMNFFLNTGKKSLPDAPASAFMHVGNGRNVIYVDRVHDLVIVIRWIENNAVNGFIKKVLEAF